MDLDLLLFNVQDLYVFMDKYNGEDLETIDEPRWQQFSTSFFPNKPIRKLYSIKNTFESLDPDIIMLVEVGGAQSLHNFNQHFLNNKYEVFLEDSLSDRGIDVGYLVKKSSMLECELLNKSNVRLGNGKRFSRGLFELRVKKDDKLICNLLLTHLKSKLDLKKEDFEGRGQRSAEVDYISKHYSKLQEKRPDLPILVCGDMNGIIYKDETEEELSQFSKVGLIDVYEALDLPLEERHTYYFFNKQRQRIPMQLDYMLINSKFKQLVDKSTRVIPIDIDLVPYPPMDLKQKKKLSSDHYPVFCRLNLTSSDKL
ncbi:MAG: hypothetical protein CME64_00210 [Halobacteriovoraceae bacterium]|nr:hypothetical protein [Halobacteriovoraceae bacterium]|tara:strand:+ start:54051 stop:54986 length:936 start_codon:yes stop_codon:yes gene_type:complete